MHPIYTVGYSAGWTPATLAAELARLGAVLWDIRYSPRSRRPEWDRAALRDLLGPGLYAHEPALGNRNYGEEFAPIVLAAPERAVPRARELLQRGPVVLMCACRHWHACHRNDAADYLRRAIGGVEVVHLDPPVATPESGLMALSLNPPWGTLIAVAARFPDLGKRIETRDWQRSYRGPLAIHQTKGLGELGGEAELAALCAREPFRSALAAVGITEAWQLPRGKVVAVADLVSIVPTEHLVASRVSAWTSPAGRAHRFELTPTEQAFGNYGPGRFGWLLADIRAMPEPVTCRGTQGLWPVPADVAAQLAGVPA